MNHSSSSAVLSCQPNPVETLSRPSRQLTLFDSVSIIVGIIIGSAIYESSWLIASSVGGPVWLLLMWLAGGIISLIGALCYAELATSYPDAGGDYVYLTRAFGRPVGFLFAWAQLWIVRPGSIGAMAYVFARYANELLPIGKGAGALMAYAAGSVVVLSFINILGVRQGKWTQNLLTAAKTLGLLAVVLVGLLYRGTPPGLVGASAAKGSDYRQALILILFIYGGWNEMAYVAAEVREPQRNILRSLLLGTLGVTVIYVLVTAAFLNALGFEGLRQAKAVAADVLRLALGDWGGRLISTLICITALGAINGMIFTGARITYAMGRDHHLYAWLGRWNPQRGVPVPSLVAQGIVTLALVIGFGWTASGFESLVNFTTPVFWVFFLLVGISLFVLRFREPDTNRPFRAPLYPVIPTLFCLSSAFMLWASVSWAIGHSSPEAFWSIGILALGAGLCRSDRKTTGNGLTGATERS